VVPLGKEFSLETYFFFGVRPTVRKFQGCFVREAEEPVGQRSGEPMEAKVYPFRWFLSRALLRECIGEDLDVKNEGTVPALDQFVDAISR